MKGDQASFEVPVVVSRRLVLSMQALGLRRRNLPRLKAEEMSLGALQSRTVGLLGY